MTYSNIASDKATWVRCWRPRQLGRVAVAVTSLGKVCGESFGAGGVSRRSGSDMQLEAFNKQSTKHCMPTFRPWRMRVGAYMLRASWRPQACLARRCFLRQAGRRGMVSASELQFGQPLHETHPHLIAPGERKVNRFALE